MIVLDGKKVASEIHHLIKEKIQRYTSTGKRPPGLAVLIVGENPASQTYVKNKAKACENVGMRSWVIELPNETTEKDLLTKINELNTNPDIDGILIQQPTPNHIDSYKITIAIRESKDVDGFHPNNVGKLSIGKLDDCFVSCTPFGVLKILEYYNINVSGKHCVVVGRSNIVGKPMASLLVQNLKNLNGTVTICHSKTKNIDHYTKQADILISAIGKENYIKKHMVKEGAVVIDVGINRILDPSTKSGYRLVGDVDYNEVAPITSAITPVPGGVGPMTIAMLLYNTMLSYERTYKN